MDGKVVNHETIRATNVFVAAYIFIFAASFFLISLDGFDMVTNFTAIAATLNNIGPGLAQVGPMMNFGSYSNPAKLVMIFDMLAGRLEIFPMLVFFMPDTWRRVLSKITKRMRSYRNASAFCCIRIPAAFSPRAPRRSAR